MSRLLSRPSPHPVNEITMAAPDVVCIKVHNGDIVHRGIVTASSTADYGRFRETYEGERATLVGPVDYWQS